MTNVVDSHLSLPLNQLTLSDDADLPPEVWELIFGQLRGKYLLTVRLVCRRWKAIVDGKRSLWKGMRIVKMKPDSAPPIPNLNLASSNIPGVSSWWSAHGEGLTSVSLSRCYVALGTLVGVLRQCPNLVQLRLDSIEFDGTEEPQGVDFRLEKLEELSINDLDRVFDVFGTIFPHLRKLVLFPSERDDQNYEDVIRLIQSVQKTLQILTICGYTYFLQNLALMDDLRLKSIFLYKYWPEPIPIELLIALDRRQPVLENMILKEHLRHAIGNSYLIEIGRNLPRLSRLEVKIDPATSLAPSFLATMGHLNTLRLNGGGGGDYLTLNLAGYKCPNLTDLALVSFNINFRAFHLFLSECKNLTTLILSHCLLDGFAELLDMIAKHPAIRSLALRSSRFDAAQRWNVLPGRLNKLDLLEINACKGFTVPMLVEICKLSQRVRDFVFIMTNDSDTVVSKLSVHLTNVRRLSVGYCNIRTACAKHILDRCPLLESLTVAGVDDRFRKKFEKLLNKRRRFVELQIH